MGIEFYSSAVRKLRIAEGESVLFVCAGNTDKMVAESAGLRDAAISNLSPHGGVTDYEPYKWQYLDVEDISLPDGSFDWVIVHAGLHHCASPHRGLCEMFRVARKGILIVEARDSLAMSFARRIGLTPEFETEPVLLTKGEEGGLRNGPVPNFIYRWTEAEVEKAIASLDPAHENAFEYLYDWRLPLLRLAMSRNPIKRAAVKLASFIVPVLRAVAPRQGNSFAIIVRKTGKLRSWMATSTEMDLNWGSNRYNLESYRGSRK